MSRQNLETEKYIIKEIKSVCEYNGWEYVPYNKLKIENKHTIEESILRESLIRINKHIKGKIEIIDEVIKYIKELAADVTSSNIVKNNEMFLRNLRKEFTYNKEIVDINIIDFDNPLNNRFIMTSTVETTSLNTKNKHALSFADVILFVNGIPLSIVECRSNLNKNININTNNIKRMFNDYKNKAPEVFVYSGFSFATDGIRFIYGDAINSLEPWTLWRGNKENASEEILNRQTFLNLIKNYILFIKESNNTIKLVSKHHEYETSENIVKSIIENKVKRGIVGHTHGLNKLNSILFTIMNIKNQGRLKGYKVILVEDSLKSVEISRNCIRGVSNLSDFIKFRSFSTTDSIMNLEKDGEFEVLITNINRFREEKLLNLDSNIIVIINNIEKRLTALNNLLTSLPNAFFFDFNKILLKSEIEKNNLFGNYLSIYSAENAISDNIITEIKFESRESLVDFRGQELINQSEININYLDSIYIDKRIKLVCEDIMKHYKSVVEPSGFNAMIVCQNLKSCIKYKEYLDEILGTKVSTVFSNAPKSSNEFAQYYRTISEERELTIRYNNKNDDLKIFIVTKTNLSNYVLPMLQTVYLDSKLEKDKLIECLFSTNYSYRNKKYGLIVDYTGQLDKFKKEFNLELGFVKKIHNYDLNFRYLKEHEVDDYNQYNIKCKCDIDRCENEAEYAIFKYNEDSIEFINEYICSEHKDNYELNRNEDIIRRYLPLNPRDINIRLKTISEEYKADYAETNKDIEPFVKLILNEDLSLPLTIGVFGSWGSGKTFFTRSIKNELEEYDHICTIDFNAWNYYDSNITTNLVSNIYQSLYNKMNKEETELNIQGEEEKLEEYKNEIDKKLEGLDNEIEALEEKNKKYFKKMYKEVFSKIEGTKGINKKINELEDLNCTIKDIDTIIKEIVKIIPQKVIIKSCTYIVIILVILTTIKYTLNLNNIVFKISSIISSISVIFTQIFRYFNKYKSSIRDLKEKLKYINSERDKIKKLQEEKDSIKIKKETLDKDIWLNTIKDKCNKYKNKEGFISIIKKDIEDLEIFKKENKIDKIILIIDDLDRCPAKQVVEVLQTIQLLLCTNLFIVIIGVDTKWINNCISSIYNDILEDDKRIFAINYLEKIIHIPFWIDELNNGDSLKFIKNLCEEVGYTEINQSNDSSKASNEERTSEDSADTEVAATVTKENSIDETNVHNEAYDNEEDEDNEAMTEDEDNEDMTEDATDILEQDMNLTKQDILLLESMEFLLDGVSPRKIKRFFNTLLLIKLKYGTDRKNYNKLVFIAASIILKSEYSCKIYNKMVLYSLRDSKICTYEFLNNYKEELHEQNGLDYHSHKFISDFIEYVNQNHMPELKLTDFVARVREASRYTYYHEEIFRIK